MPLLLIKGTFKPGTGIPDGDTVRFAPDNPDLVFRLTRQGRPPRLSNGTIALRYEGIDALERSAHQPESGDATANNLRLLGLSRSVGEARGHVFSRLLDTNGRVIAFVGAGDAAEPDGSEVFFDGARLRDTINYQQLVDGYAYPLFYNTLFNDLRDEFIGATAAARNSGRGVWANDVTNAGTGWGGRASLGTLPPLMPKLWRRLQDYCNDREFGELSDTLDAFPEYLRMRSDRLLVLSEQRFTGFDNVVKVDGNQVSLRYQPENMVFMS